MRSARAITPAPPFQRVLSAEERARDALAKASALLAQARAELTSAKVKLPRLRFAIGPHLRDLRAIGRETDELLQRVIDDIADAAKTNPKKED